MSMQPAASAVISESGQSSRLPELREQISAEELAVVLSHYDIGIIDSVVEFPRGSRKAPKLLIVCERGKFLLKRRAKGKDDPFKVAFAHSLQLYLAGKQFPLPHLVGTKKDNNSMVQWGNSTYELFEYIPGSGYPQTLESTYEAGKVLALYHKLLTDFQTEFQPPTGSYHLSAAVEQGLHSITSTLSSGAGNEAAMLNYLTESYRHAGQIVQAEGMENWPKQIVHADWHPGNMLYRENHVAAVIDYDAARLLPRVVDVANGALQFSILAGEEDVSKWPDYLDESRLRRFLRGYDEVLLLSEAEIRALPWLMIEALIAEAVFPVAATGSFGRMEGLPFLYMVQRKVYWLQRCADRLIELAEV